MSQAQKNLRCPKTADAESLGWRSVRHSEPPPAAAGGYTAKDIEVLEGFEPVRQRPGMYIGGVDERALHHLFAEVLDNSMDEAVAGYADRIEVELEADGTLRVTDNGRGMPIDPHPKFPKKSALEIIMTVLHAGGKFSDKVYHTSGGLHGVGVSVVNALSDRVEVEVARDRKLYRQTFSRGAPTSKLSKCRPGAQSPRHDGALPSRSANFRSRARRSSPRACSRWRARRPICNAACKSVGSARPSASPTTRPPKRCCTSRTASPTFLSELTQDKTRRRHRSRSPAAVDKAARTAASNGRWLGSSTASAKPTASSAPTATRSTRPTAASMKRASARRSPRASRPTRNSRANKKAILITQEDVMNTVAGLVSVFIKRPAIRGPDQGPPRFHRSAEDRRTSRARSVRPLARRATRRKPAKLLDWVITQAEDRAEAAQGEGSLPPKRDAQTAPARQARRLRALRRERTRKSSWSKATAPAAPPNRRATARRRQSCRCAARFSTSLPRAARR